ncbi:class I SAM-dependent methyltransferase [Sporosarcina jiandibaonis]|uniref:class I SAM-dependent methyltransferase n=1 Tax=Sporosarcina jiandibaonis TaxID=2715535 RepID=UPI00155205B3|nr:class I SAM-dependent methyltransferase [Sporosarcina jiandibaonis]
MKRSYAEFASVYDELMSEIPYDTYVELINLAGDGIAGKKILDVGCGTGLLSVKLAKLDGLVTGVDLSPDMLSIARDRARSLNLPVTFVEQPMQQLNGFSNFDMAVIAIDSLNYVIEEEAVLQTFRNIYNSLKVGGVLLFDVHSTYKMDVIFMESPFIFDNKRISYIWTTEAGDEPHSVYSELAFFNQMENDLYKRFDEVHYQRTFSVLDYVAMLTEVGFSIERIFSDWQDLPPNFDSERIFFQVCK